jgi:predicted CXXCH cytochrome family protein
MDLKRWVSILTLGGMIAIMLGMLAGAVRSAEQSGTPAAPPTYMSRYLGADAEKIGSDKCIVCHGNRVPKSETSHFAVLDKKEGSAYKGFGCEACHGPGSKHNGDVKAILNPAKMDKSEVTDFCTKCHAKKGSLDKDPWLKSVHYVDANLTCLTCHSGHSEFDKYLVKEKVVDVCVGCHAAEKTAFDAGTHNGADPKTMNCAMCHNPHNVGPAEESDESENE